MLPFWARIELGAMAKKKYFSYFFSITEISGHLLGGSYNRAEMQLVYSTASNEWAIFCAVLVNGYIFFFFFFDGNECAPIDYE